MKTLDANQSAHADPASSHGHTILRWLAETPMSRQALHLRAARELGAGAFFHTCDTDGLTLDALIELLATRGKIFRDGELWRSDLSAMCADG